MRIKNRIMTVKQFIKKYGDLEKYHLRPVGMDGSEDKNHLVGDLNPSTGINHYVAEEKIVLITVTF